jgi:two-component system KDP operon response regulator KdpE
MSGRPQELARTDIPGRVLVVDDERQIVRALSASLGAAGYAVNTAETGADALRSAALAPPDAVVLDLRLPDLDGVEVCRRLREWSQVPVVVVSAVGDESMKVTALDAGADDYVTKPYSTGELLARLRAAMRRAAAPAGEHPEVAFGDVVVDLGRREVRRAGEVVHLTRREYGLLAELARHPGRLLTRAMLLRAVWGPGAEGESHYLHVHMSTLRRKLERDPARPRHLMTEIGVGYRLRPD